jgi:hypothetical protein
MNSFSQRSHLGFREVFKKPICHHMTILTRGGGWHGGAPHARTRHFLFCSTFSKRFVHFRPSIPWRTGVMEVLRKEKWRRCWKSEGFGRTFNPITHPIHCNKKSGSKEKDILFYSPHRCLHFMTTVDPAQPSPTKIVLWRLRNRTARTEAYLVTTSKPMINDHTFCLSSASRVEPQTARGRQNEEQQNAEYWHAGAPPYKMYIAPPALTKVSRSG